MYKVKLYNVATGEELIHLLPLPLDEEEQFEALEKLCIEQELQHPGSRWNAVANPMKSR